MTAVAILGSGGIGHALATLLGARPDLTVTLWGRRAQRPGPRGGVCVHGGEVCAAGRFVAEPDIRRAVRGAAIVILAVPTHARLGVLREIADAVRSCRLLLSWEGTGPFREELVSIGVDWPACAGLQRSPVVARLLSEDGRCELKGVRSSVVGGAVDPADREHVRALLAALLPFRIEIARSYDHVAASPGNPLIHPARLYGLTRGPATRAAATERFYVDWDDAASEVLIALHRELARLRDVLGLSKRHVETLVDRDADVTPAGVTSAIRAETALADVPVPSREAGGRFSLDWEHRFFREDIGRGLSYIVGMARSAGVAMPTAEAVLDWYARADSASERR